MIFFFPCQQTLTPVSVHEELQRKYIISEINSIFRSIIYVIIAVRNIFKSSFFKHNYLILLDDHIIQEFRFSYGIDAVQEPPFIKGGRGDLTKPL